MNQKTFSLAAGAIFTAIAVLHILRLLFGWEAIIAGWVVPGWISWLAVVIAGYLAFEGIRFGRKSS
jgi:hypothetical protein